ncbi:hypothetical protein [Pelagibacterium montanilacus]|uniref:hypothetical protein n=1 Tax=Pelagibacterium montanilacus TaxID=2185280 RepID=UPI000F8CFF1F|nr:hypothetical protein [Pelagibacterium montanilacus]
MTTTFLIQSFQQRGRKLVSDPLQRAKSAESAIATAERIAPSKAGVVAFSQEVDVETDCYDEPQILFRIGTLPEELMD